MLVQNAPEIHQEIVVDGIRAIVPTNHHRQSTGSCKIPSPQSQEIKAIYEAGYQVYLSLAAITNARANANLLIQEVYPLAFSIPAFVDLCTQYINSGVTPPLDDATKQIYTYLNAQNWFLDLSLYQISNYIMNPASSNRTLEAWEGVMASLYHPQDSNSISALWNLWKMMDTWHATHYPLYAQSLPQPLLNDVTALYHTWLGITAESIDPTNHNNILHQLASGLIAIDTDLTNLINNQQPLTANEKMLQYVLYAPPQGGFIVPFIQYAKEFVTSPTPRNATDFSNFVAGCNFYIASVLYNSLNANLSIHKRWEPRLQLE